jgi:RNA polymerase sigma-70 factor (ECF subfamily)
MAEHDLSSTTQFVSLLTEHQGDLWAFILTLMPGHANAKDVLQKTNVVLWEKRDAFQQGTNFRAWALTCARFTVLDHLKRLKTGSFILFDSELLETIAAEAPERLGSADLRLAALESCLAKLRSQDRELLEFRYQGGHSLAEYASRVGRSVSALSVTLNRLRAVLLGCIREQLSLLEDAP